MAASIFFIFLIAGGASAAGADDDPSQTDGGNDSPYMPTDEDMGIARRPRLHADDVARDQWDRPIEFSFGRQWDLSTPVGCDEGLHDRARQSQRSHLLSRKWRRIWTTCLSRHEKSLGRRHHQHN